MPLSINYTGQSKILSYNKLNRYISLSRLDGISTENFIYYNKSKVGFSLKNELNSYDGIKNGIVVIGNYFRNIVVGSTLDYLNGFDVISSNAKMICKQLDSIDKIRNATVEELVAIDRVGEIMAKKFVEYFADEENNRKLNNLLLEVELYIEQSNDEQVLEGKTFVITGTVNEFSNRNELKKFIEDRGGKVTGSVTGKTNYLINNDINSNSSKNKKAKELGVEIIDEQGFMKLVAQN